MNKKLSLFMACALTLGCALSTQSLEASALSRLKNRLWKFRMPAVMALSAAAAVYGYVSTQQDRLESYSDKYSKAALNIQFRSTRINRDNALVKKYAQEIIRLEDRLIKAIFNKTDFDCDRLKNIVSSLLTDGPLPEDQVHYRDIGMHYVRMYEKHCADFELAPYNTTEDECRQRRTVAAYRNALLYGLGTAALSLFITRPIR